MSQAQTSYSPVIDKRPVPAVLPRAPPRATKGVGVLGCLVALEAA